MAKVNLPILKSSRLCVFPFYSTKLELHEKGVVPILLNIIQEIKIKIFGQQTCFGIPLEI